MGQRRRGDAPAGHFVIQQGNARDVPSAGRLVCGAHAAARACQETLRFRRRNPERRRDLLQRHTMDLVHQQNFTLAWRDVADKFVVSGCERMIERLACSVRGLSPAAELALAAEP
jgi:hypothetical protein